MPFPVQIAFRNMNNSTWIEEQVRERAEELAQFSDRISTCRVVLDCAHRKHHQGKIYEVHIELNVPGHPIVVSREAGSNHAHEDMKLAIKDAFDTARRQLQDHMRRMDGAVKRAVAD